MKLRNDVRRKSCCNYIGNSISWKKLNKMYDLIQSFNDKKRKYDDSTSFQASEFMVNF